MIRPVPLNYSTKFHLSIAYYCKKTTNIFHVISD
jgi:hypothetical protein